MSFDEATDIIMDKLSGKPIPDELLNQVLAEHPNLGMRVCLNLFGDVPKWAEDWRKDYVAKVRAAQGE